MDQAVHTISIGSTSHVGKSTLASDLGGALGWDVFSTDKMARHPGRPWPTARSHVADFCRSLSQDSIAAFLRHHQDNMWPGIESFLVGQRNAGRPLILEGSALRPEFLSALSADQYLCICLVAPAAFIAQRIHANSGYGNLPPDMRHLVDVFVARSIRDNTAIIEAASRHTMSMSMYPISKAFG